MYVSVGMFFVDYSLLYSPTGKNVLLLDLVFLRILFLFLVFLLAIRCVVDLVVFVYDI